MELTEALGLAVDHLSLYQLTIEEGTAFGDRYAAGRLRGLPDEDVATEMFAVTQAICEGAGLPAYEVSNHARPGAESVHNRIYWQYGDYAGIGPGAHGRLTLGGQRYATETYRSPGAWLAQVANHGSGELPREALEDEAVVSEFLLMGLRLHEGVDLQRLARLSGGSFNMNIKGLVEDGFLVLEDGKMLLTDRGRPVLNAIWRSLLGA